MTYINDLLQGLGNGAVFAALALALVVTYRSSGVVNFATGAIALYTAYTYADLRQGKLLVPFPGLPTTVDLGNQLDLVPALLVSLLIAAVLGVILYLLVFRPLRKAPPVAKAVASIGLMVIITAVMAIRVGTSPANVDPIFNADRVYHLGSLQVKADQLWFTVTVLAMTVALIALFRFTRFGLATRAAAESERGALVTGLAPERIAVINWALSSVVAGASGILIASIVSSLVPQSYTLFIVPSLAAALVGGFTAVGPTVIAGLIIGMLQSLTVNLQVDHTWLPQAGLKELVPLIVILAILVIRGRPLPSRGAIITRTLGRAPRPRNLLPNGAVAIAIALIALFATSGSYRSAVITSLMLAFICLSLVVVTGFAGQVSLAQLTLAGVAAFTLTRLTHGAGVPFPIAPIIAALAATVVGVVIGLPALRIRGLPVAVVTLALAVTVENLWFTNAQYNGGEKVATIDKPTLFGLDLGIGNGNPRIAFGVMVLVILALVGFAVAKLRTSRLGAAMLAVRANERSAAAAGINVSLTKIIAFAIGSFIAGLGGSLIGYSQGLASPGSFTAIGGLVLFATAYMAGITSLSGGLLGGVIAAGGILNIALDRAFSSLGDWYDALTGIGLVLTVILYPEGIVGIFHEMAEKFRQRREGAAAPAVAPHLVPDNAAPATTPVRRSEEVQLALRGVGVKYGVVAANDDVSFNVHKGEIVGLIGPNGAGKTTLIDAISGYAPATGSVELFGQSLGGEKPYQRIRRGLGRTFQGIELYEDLSVQENVSVGETAARHGGAHVAADGNGQGTDTLDRLFEVLQLNDVRERAVRELSQGQRQLVSIARALAGRPQVVLLDEPAGGLDSNESQWLGHRLRAIRDAGITILLVDHDMGLVLDVCDRIVVLDLGKVIDDGPPNEVQANPAVAKAYLGTTHAHHAEASA